MAFSCRRYVIGTLELLVAENYMIVYLNAATSRKKMPTVGWLRKCYQQIDRRWVKSAKSQRHKHSGKCVAVWLPHSPFFLFFWYRLRKNLKSLIIVHPSWFIRTLLALTKPFIRWDCLRLILTLFLGKLSVLILPNSFSQLQIQSENQVCFQLDGTCRAGSNGIRVHTWLYQTVSTLNLNIVVL